MTQTYVAATMTGGLEDQVSPVFGRAHTFTVVEVEEGKILKVSVVSNPYVEATGGAGIRAAQFVAERKPRAVFAGNFGPNVANIFAQAGIDMVTVSGKTVRQAVEEYLAGQLRPNPSFGMGFGLGKSHGGFVGFPPEGFSSPGDIASLQRRLAHMEEELTEIKRKLAGLKGGE